MPIVVACPRCSTRLSAPDNAAGKQVKCPKPNCGAVADVPAFLQAEEVQVVDAKPTAPRPRPKPARDDDDDDDDRPRKKPRRDDDDDDDDRPKSKRRRRDDDDDDYDFDHPRRKRRKKGGMGAGVVVALVLGSLVALGGIGYGIYALVSKSSDSAKKTPPPAGWKQFTYQKDGFKAYFPSEPSVNSMGGFGQMNIPGATMPESFSMYMPIDLMAPLRTSVVVMRFRSSLSANERRQMRDAMLNERKVRAGTSKDVRTVRWLGVDADEISSSQGVARVAIVGNTLYVAEIGATNGRASAAEENGFFDNFELLK